MLQIGLYQTTKYIYKSLYRQIELLSQLEFYTFYSYLGKNLKEMLEICIPALKINNYF